MIENFYGINLHDTDDVTMNAKIRGIRIFTAGHEQLD